MRQSGPKLETFLWQCRLWRQIVAQSTLTLESGIVQDVQVTCHCQEWHHKSEYKIVNAMTTIAELIV